MEPVITEEGFKMLQDPQESRSLLSAYYETLGFHVVGNDDYSSTKKVKEQAPVQPSKES